MLVPAIMRLCNNATFAILIFLSTLTGWAQQTPSMPAQSPSPSLTEDRDPVRSPDGESPAPAGTGPLHKEGEGYILRTNVEEVVLNATVLEGSKLVQNLKKDDFEVFEDGGKQSTLRFHHTVLPF